MACKGWLQKRGADKLSSTLKRTQKRFFVLSNHALSYYAATDEDGNPVESGLKGSIDLEDMKTCRRDGDQIHLMTIGKDKREWVLKANDAADAKRWHTAITQSKPGRVTDAAPDPYANEVDARAQQEEEENRRMDEQQRRREAQQTQTQRYRQEPAELTKDIVERDEQVRKIEETMQTVNDIYKDLNNLVVDQGSMLDSIESNINTASGRVEDGLDQLEQGRRIQRGKKKK